MREKTAIILIKRDNFSNVKTEILFQNMQH